MRKKIKHLWTMEKGSYKRYFEFSDFNIRIEEDLVPPDEKI